MRVPWVARRSNQSILKEINLDYSLEGTNAEAEALILWPLDAKTHAGKDGGQVEKGKTEGEMVG